MFKSSATFTAKSIFYLVKVSIFALGATLLAVILMTDREGDLLPVVSDISVAQHHIVKLDTVELSIVFKKKRDCEYQEIKWFLVDANEIMRQTKLTLLDDDTTVTRSKPPGFHHAGPWHINIEPGYTSHRGFVYHICTLPRGIFPNFKWRVATSLGTYQIPTR